MSAPTVPKSLNGVLSELVSAMSSLNNEPTPIEGAEGPYSSDKDFWVNHAYAHISAAFQGVDGLRELEASHERLRVALQVAMGNIRNSLGKEMSRELKLATIHASEAALAAIPEAK